MAENININVTADTTKAQIELKKVTDSADLLASKVQSGMATATKSMLGFNTNLDVTRGGMGKLVDATESMARKADGLATAIAGVGMIAFIHTLLTGASAIKDMSEAFGVSIEKILEVEAGFAKAGRSTDQMTQAISKFNQSIEEARNGSAKAQVELEKFGLKNIAPGEELNAFNTMMRDLSKSAGDTAKQVAAVSLAGKSMKGIPTGDYVAGLDAVKGKMGELAKSVEVADETQKRLEQQFKNVKNATLNMLEPALKGLNDILGPSNAARVEAGLLAVAMAGIAAAAVINGIKALKDGFYGLMTALGFSTGATTAETVALGINSSALVLNATLRQAGFAAKVRYYEASLATVRATIAEGVAGIELTAVQKVLIRDTWLLSSAKAALAAESGIVAKATQMQAASMASAAASTGLFTRAIALLMIPVGAVAAVLALPVWAAVAVIIAGIAAAVALCTVVWKAFGDVIIGWGTSIKNFLGGIFDWIDEKLTNMAEGLRGFTDKIGMTTPKKIEAPKPGEKAGEEPAAGATTGNAKLDLQPWLVQEAALRATFELQQKSNIVAKERLELQQKLVGETDLTRITALAAFDAESKKKLEMAKADSDISKMELQIAQGGDEAKKTYGGQLEIMKQQREVIAGQIDGDNILKKAETDRVELLDKQRRTLLEFVLTQKELIANYQRSNQNVIDNLNFEITLLGKTAEEVELLKAKHDLLLTSKNTIIGLVAEQEKLKLSFDIDATAKEKYDEIAKTIQNITASTEKQVPALLQTVQLNQSAKLIEKDRLQTIENITKAIEDQIARQQTLGGLLQSANDKKVDVDFESAQAKRNPLEKQIAAIQEAARKAALEAGRAFASAFEDSGDGLTPGKANELIDGLDLIAKKYKNIAEAQMASLDASRTWAAGSKDSMDAIVESFNPYQKAQMQVNAAWGNITKSIDTMVDSGKFSFSDLASSIIRDMIKIEIKAMALEASSGMRKLFGGFFGSIFGGSNTGNTTGPVDSLLGGAFAGGGDPPVGKPSIVGEDGPELFIPKSAGTIISNSKIGSGSGSAVSGVSQAPSVTNITNNHYNVNAVDAKSVAQLFAENRKQLLGTVRMAQAEQPFASRI